MEVAKESADERSALASHWTGKSMCRELLPVLEHVKQVLLRVSSFISS
jgi:hypothetical protein